MNIDSFVGYGVKIGEIDSEEMLGEDDDEDEQDYAANSSAVGADLSFPVESESSRALEEIEGIYQFVYFASISGWNEFLSEGFRFKLFVIFVLNLLHYVFVFHYLF